jgi:aconitate hydratase
LRGTDYVDFLQTELLVKMQLLKWLCCNYARRKAQVAVPTTVHCDHLIQAKVDAVTDLAKKHKVMKFLIFFLQCLINTELVLKGWNYSSGSP